MAAQELFDFKKQLLVGDRGEELFMERYPKKLIIFPENKADFQIQKTGQLIELKTDTYNIEKTSSFFIERYSDVLKRTPGGPFRAERDNVDIFCYMFVRHNVWFQFNNIPELNKFLHRYIRLNKLKLVYVKNRTWVTGGYLIPRTALADLYTEYTF